MSWKMRNPPSFYCDCTCKFNKYSNKEWNFKNYVYRATPERRIILTINKMQNLIMDLISGSNNEDGAVLATM